MQLSVFPSIDDVCEKGVAKITAASSF